MVVQIAFYMYSMVDVLLKQVQEVLDGDLDPFIASFLRSKFKQR